MFRSLSPPVALGAYAAATIAGANPMRTGLEAMRLGSIIYFVPFFFVLDNGLILKGQFSPIVLVTTLALIGITMIAGALQGYLVGVGNLTTHKLSGWVIRAAIPVGGLFMATPGGSLVPFSNTELAMAALVLAGPAAILAFWLNRRQTPAAA